MSSITAQGTLFPESMIDKLFPIRVADWQEVMGSNPPTHMPTQHSGFPKAAKTPRARAHAHAHTHTHTHIGNPAF